MATTNNTVEYRATLDASGVKAGAAEASQALAGIGGDGLKSASTGLDSAAQSAKELGTTAKSTAQDLETLGAKGTQTGTELARGMTQANKGMDDFGKQTKDANQEVNRFSTQGARQQLNHMGLTAGETTQAMRYLPMQMTDVAVSLASGMPAYMVAIQQGGQLKDSFNGIGNAVKATTGYLLGAINPVTVFGAAVGVAGLAYYQGSKEADGFRNALVMNGGVVDASVSRLSEMSRAVSAVTGTQREAAQVITEMAGTGKIAAESLQQFTEVAINLEKYAGQPIKNTVDALTSLGDEPVKASLKLNERYNYLTEAIYRQIKALDEQGQKEQAAALAQKTYADAMGQRTAELKANLGTLERAWDSLAGFAKRGWDAMLNLGRAATLADVRGQIEDTNKQLNDMLSGDGFASNGGGAAFGGGNRGRLAQIDRLKAKLGELNAQAAPLEAEDAKAQIDAEEKARHAAEVSARARIDDQKKAVRTRAEIRKSEIEQLDRDRATLDMKQGEYDKLLAGINEKYKDPKGPSAKKGGIKVTDNELANMQGQLQAAKDYYEQLMTLGSGAKALNSAERDSLIIGEQIKRTTDAKVIAKLQEKQAMADALGVQLRTNEGLEQSFAAHAKVIETVNAEADAISNQAQRQEAANQVYGKGKTAIEQMTLAELQKQMAEAQGSDSFDPKYIAGLELKINAQKRFVDALGQADYKAVNQHTEQLLTNAKALGAVYDDELTLSGKTGLERAKIAALRQVELKYARELARIDASNISAPEKETQRIKVLEAQGIESAAAVAKATDQYMAQTAANINSGLTDALMSGFKSGEGFAKNFGKSLMDMFDRMVLRPVISFITEPFSMVINGVLQSFLGGGGGGGGGWLDLASNANTAYNAYTGQGWAGQAYNYVSGLWGGGSAAWGAAGAQASGAVTYPVAGSVGAAAPSSGAGAGMGAVGWAAAAVIFAAYLGGMFKEERMVGQGLTGELGGDMYGYQLMRESGGLFDGPDYRYVVAEKKIADLKAQLEVEKEAGRGDGHKANSIRQNLEYYERDYADAIEGSKAPIKLIQDAYVGMREDTAKKAEMLGLDGEAVRGMKVSLGLDEIHPDTGGKGLQLTGLTQQEAAAKIEQALKTANEELARSLLGSYQEVTREVTSTVWENVQVGTDGDTEQWSRVGREVTETVTEMQWVMSEYVREGETATQALNRMATGLTVVNQAYELLGAKLLDASLASGDWASKLVEATGGLEKFNQAVNTYYDLYYSDEEKRKMISDRANKGMEDKGLDLRTIDADAKAKYRALVDKAIAAGDEALIAWLLDFADDFAAGADAAAASLDASTKAIADKLEELAREAEEAVNKAWDALQRAISAEREAAQNRLGVAQELYNSTKGIVTLIRSNVDELRGEVQATADMSAQAGRRFIDEAVLTASTTGYLPEHAALNQAVNAARGGMGTENYASRVDYERDRLTMAAKLQTIGDKAQDQLSFAEKSLQAEKDTIARLDDLLKTQKQAVDIWKGIDTGVLSVDEALERLINLTKGKNEDGSEKITDTPSSGGGGGSGGATLGGSGATVGGSEESQFVGFLPDGRAKYKDGSISEWPVSEASAKKLADGINPFGNSNYSTGQTTSGKVKWDGEQGLYVPQFKVGINRTPGDMLAQLHADEAVVPAHLNPFNPNAASPWLSGARDDSALQALLQQILIAIERQAASNNDIRQNTKDSADVLLRSSRGGNAQRNVLEL